MLIISCVQILILSLLILFRDMIFALQGDLQEVQLIAGPHGYLIQCPQLDSSCPTCGQFSILQNTVEQLMYNLNELTRRVSHLNAIYNFLCLSARYFFLQKLFLE